MDPASIIGLVGVATQSVDQCASLFKFLSQLYKEVKDAPTQAATLRNEVNTLMSVVNDLKFRLDNFPEMFPDSQEAPIAKSLKELKELVDAIMKHCDPKRMKDLSGQLKWPFQKRETEEYIKRIENYKKTLTLAMQSSQMYPRFRPSWLIPLFRQKLEQIDSHVQEGFGTLAKAQLCKAPKLIVRGYLLNV